LVTTTPIDTKTNRSLDAVVTRPRAKFCRRTTRRLGGVWKQKK